MVETIAELKEICRKKHKKGVTKPCLWATLFTRRVSIYITWFIVKYTRISANQVTIWQLIAGLFGLGLLCFPNTWIALIGTFFLHLSYIFDNVDGEVARYRKNQSINGMFLDFVNHEIIIPFIYACLAFHYYFLTASIVYFGLGLIILMCQINPISKARLTTINYLIEKRKSPTYDIRNYQSSDEIKSSTCAGKSQSKGGIIALLNETRKMVWNCVEYPNDLIIISTLIIAELVINNSILGWYFLILLTTFSAANFVLGLYVHLKHNVVERYFYKYAKAFSEISERVK